MVLGLPRPSLCVTFDQVRLPTETARKFFSGSFSGFSNLFDASAKLFCTLSFAQSRKNIILILKTFRHFKTAEIKNFVMMTSIVHLSSNRS